METPCGHELVMKGKGKYEYGKVGMCGMCGTCGFWWSVGFQRGRRAVWGPRNADRRRFLILFQVQCRRAVAPLGALPPSPLNSSYVL